MCCAASPATSAAPNVPPRKSHSETGVSVGSTACMISWSKLFRAEDRGTVARKRTNCAIIVSGEKSRVQKRRYALFAMERELYRAPEQEANPQQSGRPRELPQAQSLKNTEIYLDSVGDVFENSAVISCSRLRNDSPTFEKTSAHAARSFSSTEAESPVTTSRD